MTDTIAEFAPGVDVVDDLRQVVGGLSAGRHREGQDRMCRAVQASMDGAGHLVASAGTGTGKSLAYLVPAALSEQPVVIATATKALQDQLLQHDIPRVREGLGLDLMAVTLKGRSNYLCMQKLAEINEEVEGGLFEAPSATAGQQLQRIIEWADVTETGDQADLPFQPDDGVWRSVSVDSRECPGSKQCASADSCFAERAADAAADADIVIVNQHLYCLHAVMAANGAQLLPEHEVVVIDEAHELEDIASSVFGASITLRRFANVVSGMRDFIDAEHTNELTNAADKVFLLLSEYRDAAVPSPLPSDLDDAVRRAQRALNTAIRELRAADGPSSAAKAGALDWQQRMLRLGNIAAALRADLLVASDHRESWAMWVESNRASVTWRVAPVDVAGPLRTFIWEHTTGVMCSATIPPNFASAWGLEHGPHTHIDVGSPFDYESQAMLFVPEGMPPPKSPDYEDAVHDNMESLMRMVGGRTLALFTSYRAMDAAAIEMRKRLSFPILTQRDMQKPALLKAFAENPECCLLGTLGLWQGVDIPGESLSLVIIARLPFPRPDDPLLQARRKAHGDGWFMKIDVPRATTRLAQGAGRLIRAENDYGIVAVLDSRLADSRYGRGMLNSLPPYVRTRDRRKVEQFFWRIPWDEMDTPSE